MLKVLCERLLEYLKCNKNVLKKAIDMDEEICKEKIYLENISNTIKEIENEEIANIRRKKRKYCNSV